MTRKHEGRTIRHEITIAASPDASGILFANQRGTVGTELSAAATFAVSSRVSTRRIVRPLSTNTSPTRRPFTKDSST